MVDWVEARGREKPPPPAAPAELVLFFNIQSWGDPWGRGWMKWPAGWMPRLRLARNVYQAWDAYTRAGNRAEWSKDPKNASFNGMVGQVKSLRYEAEAEVSRVERWEKWNDELRTTNYELGSSDGG